MRFETVNLGIPGPTGATGADGPQGPQGEVGPQGPPGTVLEGAVYYVSDIAGMRAIEAPTPGSIVYVGPQADQFLVVDDATLGSDGGTVFIPDSELSAVQEKQIPPTYFNLASGANIAMEFPLSTAEPPVDISLDFESVEVVLTDGGETLDIWNLHGHVMLPKYAERTGYPQLPLIDTARGQFRDPGPAMTNNKGAGHPLVRTGGVLVRYRYATSGLRLKRVIPDKVFQLRWWPVIAVDDEAPGVQTDNSGKICWCLNAAAAAGAEAVFVDRMYHFGRVVEIPDGVALRGRGPGLSGFRVMDNAALRELLLSTSSAAPSSGKEYVAPILTPATRHWSYDSFYFSHACTFFPATGARRIRISELEFDGNIDNNMRLFTQKGAEYAYGYALGPPPYIWNTPTHAGIAISDGGSRVIPEGSTVELHNVKSHGYTNSPVYGNHNCTIISTGRLEIGNCLAGHLLYWADGVYEAVRCFGYWFGDGIRARHFVAKSVEYVIAPMPDVMFTLDPYPNSVGTLVADQYKAAVMYAFSLVEPIPQFQQATTGNPYPKLPRQRLVVEHLAIDATGLDAFPEGETYQPIVPFYFSSDNIHIKSGKIRFGALTQALSTVMSTATNNLGLAPYRNAIIENLHIEYASRKGVSLYASGTLDGGWTETQFRNITFEPRAATHLPGDPAPSGTNILLGAWRFREIISSSFSEGRDFEFSAVTPDATLNGKYIDITPPDTGAPTFRLWFYFAASPGAGTPPSAGGTTLVQVYVASAGATTARVAAAFSLAVGGTVASPGVPSPYLTAATFGTKSVIGSWSQYHHETNSLVVADVTNAAGVTTALRSMRRNYEPSVIGFERFIANDPVYSRLLDFAEIGANRDIYFTFKDCVFGAYFVSVIYINGAGSFNAAGSSASDLIKDKVHWSFENTIFDLRDGTIWQSLDLFFYAGKFRNCRVRTPAVGTTASTNAGLTTLGTGYETLFSEQSGTEEWTTPGAAVPTTRDIQTKLFWLPKDGQTHLYPANAATWLLWSTVSFEWLRKGGVALADNEYYQGSATPSAINEDRRAPLLRLTFSVAPPINTLLRFAWAAAVSP